ncbi:SDR family NAD(P)-dependent oxidoreductase [Nocardia stercoris]|uniref:SDR family NAD(P)-dependent oxidoreductase n=1 Tax=Nocardia stercoris TaxID=2483361 RepID=A0A3M2L7C4_9NOCA|nr:SDR family NAD(P)-dependent oxidoreductase [Nocardia stercoris]RMI31815.1 SDR family NAD(P)-dependent oxidoreductase [Nocardia stercoris]
MTDKVVLITGTSTGIGFDTAVATAQSGFTTVATMRDLAKAQPLRETGSGVDIRELDVTDPASVEACLRGVLADYGRLDAVVNNAGAAAFGTAETLTMADIRQAMEVNYFGVVEVTKQALPHLRAVGGRVVTVTSVGGAIGQPFNDAYCAAKFAVEGFMQSLAPVAATVGVGVSVIEPGAVATAFVANADVDPAQAIADAGPYASALSRYLERTLTSYTEAQTGAEVGTVVLQALTAEPPVFRWQTSDWARTFVGTSLADLDGSGVLGLTGAWVRPPRE